MKKMALVILGVTLVLTLAWSSDGLCQCGPFWWKPFLIIQNVKNSPVLGDGTYFVIDVGSGNPVPAMNGLVGISARNTVSSTEGIYEFDLSPFTHNIHAEWLSYRHFRGQNGTYQVTIERFEDTFLCETDPIAPNLTPLPVPKKLKVSFENGPTSPTLSFDPVGWVPFEEGEWYRIRIYDKDYTRRIYDVLICTGDERCSKQDLVPAVTFPNNRSPNLQTHEDLVPGEGYIFRAELWKELEGNPWPQRNVLLGANFKLFKVPKK
jgi:hypothetical protein